MAKKQKVFVTGSAAPMEKFFDKHKFERVGLPANADIIVMPPGADINPAFYGQKPIKGVSAHKYTDDRDHSVWEVYKDRGKMFVGVCRGGQFLNAMNGGKLWQHVNGHQLGAQFHRMVDTLTDRTLYVSSTHHQMMRAADDGEILGIAFEANHWVDDKSDITITDAKKRIGHPSAPQYDVEIVWYKDTRCLCYQPHPEHGGEGERHFLDLIERLY